MIFASFYDQLTKDNDYFETTSTLDIIPFWRIRGRSLRLLRSFKLGPFMEYTLWLASGGNYLISEGTLRSSNTIESMREERIKQFARARPTGPHPAIITWVASFYIAFSEKIRELILYMDESQFPTNYCQLLIHLIIYIKYHYFLK